VIILGLTILFKISKENLAKLVAFALMTGFSIIINLSYLGLMTRVMTLVLLTMQNFWDGTNNIESFSSYELGIKRYIIVMSYISFFVEVTGSLSLLSADCFFRPAAAAGLGLPHLRAGAAVLPKPAEVHSQRRARQDQDRRYELNFLSLFLEKTV